MEKKLWLSSPHMGENELTYIQEAFESNWIAPLGPHVDGFEAAIEKYLGAEVHTAALSSGTAALHLALILLNVSQGDEVICQSMTFSASANPILYQHAKPVFVDSESDTWNLNPYFLETAIRDRIAKGKKPKAIIVVDIYGMPANMHAILDIAKQYDIPVIEDAAEALGSSYHQQKAGTFGDLAILSFNGNKIITTSGGGALVSRNKTFVERSKYLATQARDNAPHYEHSTVGYNYRLSNVCAAIGRGQMELLDKRVKQRRNNFHFYKQELTAFSNPVFQKEPDHYFSNRWLTAALFNDFETRERIRLHLLSKNIETRPLWKPMHLQPVFAQYPFYGDGTSEDLFEKGLCLPSGSNLTDDDLEWIVRSMKETL